MEITLSASAPSFDMLIGSFVFGFMGSPHCAGMCGALAAAACPAGRHMSWRYHLARSVGYTVLGFATGVGSSVLVGVLPELSRFLGALFGGTLLLWGLLQLYAALGGATWSFLKAPLPHGGGRFFRLVESLSPLGRPATMGLATAFLPCGFLAAGLTQAALFAHPLWSAASMFAFSLGTAPALWGGGLMLGTLTRRFPKATAVVSAALLCLSAGGILLWRGFGPQHDHSQHQGHGVSPAQGEPTPSGDSAPTPNDPHAHHHGG